MAVTSAVSDLLASFYELIASVVGTVYTVVHGAIVACVNFVTGLLQLVADVLSGAFDVVGGVGTFVTSNAAILLVGVVGAVLFVRYTASGRRVAEKKTK